MISAPDRPSTSEWWILVSIADAVRSEAVDQVHLPERARAVERPRDDARHLLGELLVVARRRQRQLADVEVEVEVGVVHPVRVVEAERHLGQPPAQRRQQRQPLGDQVVDVRERQLAVRARGGSRIASPPTCPLWRADSSARNCASTLVSCRTRP